MVKPKKQTMSREEAEKVYEDLHKTMAGLIAKEKEWRKQQGQGKVKAGATIQASAAERPERMPSFDFASSRSNRGPIAALAFVFFVVSVKIAIALMEFAGILSVKPAYASLQANSPVSAKSALFQDATPGVFTKEEVKILTGLDARRVELEEKSKRLEDKEKDINQREAEFASRLTQIREINEKLKTNREQNDRKRSEQLAQLSNVYGSMAPEESATLLEQLDITIALELIERMPEKRIAQILAHMSPDKALGLTRMLSGRALEVH